MPVYLFFFKSKTKHKWAWTAASVFFTRPAPKNVLANHPISSLCHANSPRCRRVLVLSPCVSRSDSEGGKQGDVHRGPGTLRRVTSTLEMTAKLSRPTRFSKDRVRLRVGMSPASQGLHGPCCRVQSGSLVFFPGRQCPPSQRFPCFLAAPRLTGWVREECWLSLLCSCLTCCWLSTSSYYYFFHLSASGALPVLCTHSSAPPQVRCSFVLFCFVSLPGQGREMRNGSGNLFLEAPRTRQGWGACSLQTGVTSHAWDAEGCSSCPLQCEGPRWGRRVRVLSGRDLEPPPIPGGCAEPARTGRICGPEPAEGSRSVVCVVSPCPRPPRPRGSTPTSRPRTQ